MLFGYRVRGLLVIQAVLMVIGLLMPRAIFQEYAWWIIGAWFLAVLWWINRSSARHWHEREQIETERKARRSA